MFPADPAARRRALLEIVERVAPVLAAGADTAERDCTLPPATVEALESSGLLGLKTPAVLGGAEADPITQIDVLEEVSRIDASTGWCLAVGATTVGLPAAFLPDEGLADMLAGGRLPRTAGVVMPAGTATPVDGGYRVTGRWSFASGIRHAEWAGVGVRIAGDPARAREHRIVMVPSSAVTVHDNWRVAGLEGTGSCDISLADVFVPERLTWDLDMAPPRRGGRLYHLGFPAFVANEHAAFAIGIARRTLDEVAGLAGSRRRGPARTLLADRPAFQRALAEDDLRLRAARALVVEVYEDAWRRVEAGEALAPRDQAVLRAAAVHTTEVAVGVVTRAFRHAGGAAIFRDGVLQRCLRDVNAAAQHFVVSDSAYEAHGQALLGRTGLDPMA